MDAAAAAAIRELRRFAGDFPADAPRGLAQREYGVALFLMPDGSIVMGEITHGLTTYAEGRGTVIPNTNSPLPGGVIFAYIHTHNTGGHLPSGSPGVDNLYDYGLLRWIGTQLGTQRSLARLYIVADPLWNLGDPLPVEPRINVYDETNIIPAINGDDVLGPEVNPNGQPCP